MRISEIDGFEYTTKIREILNHAIVTSTTIFHYNPRTAEEMKSWLESKKAANYPIMGALDDDGRMLGFASYGSFRAWPAYKYTVEHSVYVHHEHRRKGIARKLLSAIIEKASEQNYHSLIGCIESRNLASIELHEKAGFKNCGTLHEVGFKFGGWLDISFYQLILSTPSDPKDG